MLFGDVHIRFKRMALPLQGQILFLCLQPRPEAVDRLSTKVIYLEVISKFVRKLGQQENIWLRQGDAPSDTLLL